MTFQFGNHFNGVKGKFSTFQDKNRKGKEMMNWCLLPLTGKTNTHI